MTRKNRSPAFCSLGFSLIEVVAAIGIFAIGMVAVLSLFAPVTKSVSNVSDAEAAARVADAVRSRLQALTFAQAATLLQDEADMRKNDISGSYNPNDGARHPQVIFGKLNGDIGLYDAEQTPKTWYAFDPATNRNRAVADAEKFFEIELVRDPVRSTDILLAYTMRVRWPSFIPAPNGSAQFGANPAGGQVTFDHGKKQVMFYAGSVPR